MRQADEIDSLKSPYYHVFRYDSPAVARLPPKIRGAWKVALKSSMRRAKYRACQDTIHGCIYQASFPLPTDPHCLVSWLYLNHMYISMYLIPELGIYNTEWSREEPLLGLQEHHGGHIVTEAFEVFELGFFLHCVIELQVFYAKTLHIFSLPGDNHSFQ